MCGSNEEGKVHNILLKQQHQEILFYTVAWSVALGLGSRMMPKSAQSLGTLAQPGTAWQSIIKIHANFLSHAPWCFHLLFDLIIGIIS